MECARERRRYQLAVHRLYREAAAVFDRNTMRKFRSVRFSRDADKALDAATEAWNRMAEVAMCEYEKERASEKKQGAKPEPRREPEHAAANRPGQCGLNSTRRAASRDRPRSARAASRPPARAGPA